MRRLSSLVLILPLLVIDVSCHTSRVCLLKLLCFATAHGWGFKQWSSGILIDCLWSFSPYRPWMGVFDCGGCLPLDWQVHAAKEQVATDSNIYGAAKNKGADDMRKLKTSIDESQVGIHFLFAGWQAPLPNFFFKILWVSFLLAPQCSTPRYPCSIPTPCLIFQTEKLSRVGRRQDQYRDAVPSADCGQAQGAR